MRTTRNEQSGCAPEAAEALVHGDLERKLALGAAALRSELPEGRQPDVAQRAMEALDHDPLVLHVLATHGC